MKDPTLQALSALFLAFPSQERTDNEKELGRVYLMAVEGIPADFVAMTCKRFIQGRIERSLTFRPTPAELAAECRRLQDEAQENDRLRRLPGPRPVCRLPGARQPFRPYPKLWAALADEPELGKALNAMTFDGMTGVSKLMATEGIEAAKAKLRPIASAPDAQRKDPAA